MRKILLLLLAFSVLGSGCATVMTGMMSLTYQGAPLVLAYDAPEIVRDQDKVATLILPSAYGLEVDGLLIKEFEGSFNPELRVSVSGNTSAYMVDVMPGIHSLTVSYDGVTPGGNNVPAARAAGSSGKVQVSGSYSGPPLLSWERTSKTTHTLKGGEIYVVAPAILSVTGDMDIYPVSERDRAAVIETRNMARFQSLEPVEE